MRYIETRQNSPDRWALAGAIDFAQKQERQALLGYVANAALADRLIHTDLPDAGEDFNIEKRQDGSEVITMGWGDIDPPPDVKYTMERRNGDWIITSFEILQSSAKDNSPTNQK